MLQTTISAETFQRRLEALADCLEGLAHNHNEDFHKQGINDYIKGTSAGYASAYEVAAKAIRDILDPESFLNKIEML